jgi:exonuclease III
MAIDITNDILKHFGGISKNNLLSIIDKIDDVEASISSISESPYIDTSSLSEYIGSFNHTFSFISLNIQSLNSKFNQLKILVEMLAESKIILGAICLQETWLSDKTDVNLFSLSGYTAIVLPASCSSHGGLIIYIHDDFTFNVRDIYKKSDAWEGLFIDIYHTSFSKKLTLCNIYRPPRPRNDDIKSFINIFSPILENLSKENDNLAVCGDFNIDLLQIDQRLKFNDYFDMYTTNGLLSNIILPTRFSRRNATLIDHIFSKLDNTSTTKSAIIYSNISDHLPCLMCVSFKTNYEPRPKYITIQSKTASCFNNFYDDVSKTDFLSLLDTSQEADPNENYNKLSNKLHYMITKHFPIRKVKFNKYKHKSTPWITNGILISLKYRDKLYRELKSVGFTPFEYSSKKLNLDTYNGILNKTIKNAKKSYYFSQFNTHQKDSKKNMASYKMYAEFQQTKKFFSKFLFNR